MFFILECEEVPEGPEGIFLTGNVKIKITNVML